MLLTAIVIIKYARHIIDMLPMVTGRIMCSEGCQNVQSGMHKLFQESKAEGAIRLASPDYPPGYAVTITAGQDTSNNSQTDVVLPAAVNLLPSFAQDHRELASCGSVQLVKSSVYRTHQLWYYNQTHTAVLFSNVPSDGFVNLKVWPQTAPACTVLCTV